MQLYTTLHLATDLRYDVSINVRIEDGITNGASCIIKKLCISGNNPTGTVWVEFNDKNVGEMTRKDNKCLYKKGILPSWTPIKPITRQFNPRKQYQVIRMHFPLRPASAKTVHRSQGDTVDQLYIDFKGRPQPHLHYVALSRVTTPTGLHLRNFVSDKITVSQPVVHEMNRLRSSSSKDAPFAKCPDSQISIFFYVNAQSLHKHLADVATDYRLSTADLLICSETRFSVNDSTQDIALPGFQLPFRNDESGPTHQRPAHGMAVYVTPNKNFTTSSTQHNYKSVEVTDYNFSCFRPESFQFECYRNL